MAPTFAQQQTYLRFQTQALAAGLGQTTYLSRHREGTITSAPDGGQRYSDPDPRVSDNPTDTFQVWAIYAQRTLRGNRENSGDVKSVRAWIEVGEVSFPAIVSDGTLLPVQDEDFIVLADGHRARIENPCLSPDGAYWLAEYVRMR